MSVAQRLLEHVRATVPAVADVSLGESVRVFPADLQAAAQAAIDSFDWSPAAHQQWVVEKNPEKKGLADAAAQAVADNAAFLAAANPNAAQVLAQVRALTRQVNKIIPRLLQVN